MSPFTPPPTPPNPAIVFKTEAVKTALPTESLNAVAFRTDLTAEQLTELVGTDPSSSTSISERGVGLGTPSR
jgi:hypothetical protein